MKTACISIAIAALAAFPVLAQSFGDVDADGDGMASYEEVSSKFPNVTEDDFAGMDADGNGGLDGAEMAEAMDKGSIAIDDG